ncbi:glutathione transport system permease protein GsiD [archaeon]|nr:glutathione transport system permease protein GsiD [archaeon]
MNFKVLAVLILIIIVFSLSVYSMNQDKTTKVNLKAGLKAPSLEHPFGTDNLGRDILIRVVAAISIDIPLALLIAGLSVFLGTFLGLLGGYFGGVYDRILVMVMDVFLGLPSMIFAVVLVGALGPSTMGIILALTLTGWIKYARIVRAYTLSLKEQEFVESARALGASDFYIISHHILKNVLSPVIVLGALHTGYVILSVASLGFLGLGIQPPTPEWGTMLNNGRVYIMTAWWMSLFPGLMILITVMLFNSLGERLREALDATKTRRRQEIDTP